MTGSRALRTSTQARTYLMCPPEYFAVTYAINPWMHPDDPVDADRARRQWEQLRATFTSLGHTVRTIAPVAGPAGHGLRGQRRVRGRRQGARAPGSGIPQRAAEGPAYRALVHRAGLPGRRPPRAVNEGEGDLVFTGRAILAGHGFRTDLAVRDELTELFGLPVISLRLVDPRFYHLDTALVVLDSDTAAYYPAAFDDAGRAALASHFAELIEAKDEDAEVLGLNAVSDGRHVVLPRAGDRALRRSWPPRGSSRSGVDLSELLKAGGGPKCCTLELR